ncbi:hypothetical protein CEE37_05370 [candidate division LCP-89 bacterium B3_LCP]|uniref:Secretion system C-terminal sorting domain-containing protein n=1 Tax=candidate division LCP-89 bacterium B3_LCP TaxID=2012998 RepID=A0A532V1Q2_UNCL8|nr:MAG: hypothetical protein CEE37_05370 [candidate division LCP-89 bacterium B3_LCP]
MACKPTSFIILLITTLMVFSASHAQDLLEISIDSTSVVFGETCFAINVIMNSQLSETVYFYTADDTVYYKAYQEVGENPVLVDSIFCPFFPTVGTSWGGFNDGPAIISVVDNFIIDIPVGSFEVFKLEARDAHTLDLQGGWTFGESIGLASQFWLSSHDTSNYVTDSYTVVGGTGIFPLAVGNQWTQIQGEYTGIVGDFAHIPASLSFDQNYPNPFNPSTNIRFSIPKAQYVTISIYNSQGKLVENLLGGFHPAGNYDLSFNGSLLPSGIYFANLKAGDQRETIKMLLMK